jgi:DNA-binding MarR family transcriptional regulator
LESGGLVSRGAPLNDPRTRELALKPAGRRALQSANELLGERLGELLVDLPRPEADALVRSLERVDAALSGTAPPRRPKPPKPPR